MSFCKRLIYLFALLLAYVVPMSAQQTSQTDSLVRLMSAQSAQLIEDKGVSYRKVVGPARFLHNDTYLVCDTALWNLSTNIIKAIGNVKIIQDQTVLSGDNLDYLVDDDLAQFRGSVVQLQDKDRNTLRTKYLDYNTKDSVATFFNGGAMKDKDGQVIESNSGTYDSKIKTFTFTNSVNMFSDSSFVKTSKLTYNTDTGLAVFPNATDVWNSDKMLSAGSGRYDRAKGIFFFTKNVHMMSKAQEGWADSLYYYNEFNNVDMRGHVQLVDTTRNVAAFGGKLFYEDSLQRVTMTRNAAVMLRTKEEEKIDSVWVGADTLIYRSIRMCDVDSVAFVVSKERVDDINSDPITEYRKKAAEEAAKAKAEAEANDPNRPPTAPTQPAEQNEKTLPQTGKSKRSSGKESADVKTNDSKTDPVDIPDEPVNEVVDTLSASPSLPDTLSINPSISDSLSIDSGIQDSLAVDNGESPLDVPVVQEPLDTTKVGFANAFGHVKVFRTDLQVACDSLAYCDLDSLARLYKNPVIWNEANRQYSADSIAVAIKNQSVDKARLMSNAFIAIQEDSLLFDQIRSAEMMAYFDTTGALKRFDALGGADAIFYLEENETLATVNKLATKMMSATFVDSNIDRVYYFEKSDNDFYPTVQLPRAERELKGFSWQIERRPNGKEDIIDQPLRPSERKVYEDKPRTTFRQTDLYFPGYMKEVLDKIAKGEVAKSKANSSKSNGPTSLTDTKDVISEDNKQLLDLTEPEESTVSDTTAVVKPTIEENGPADSDEDTDEVVGEDTSDEETEEEVLDPKEAAKKAREAARQARIEAREARWAELDAKDAEKAKIKEEKALKKKRAKTLKMLRKMDKSNAKDNEAIERYQRMYEKKKSRQADKSSTNETPKSNNKVNDSSAPSSKPHSSEIVSDPTLLRTV